MVERLVAVKQVVNEDVLLVVREQLQNVSEVAVGPPAQKSAHPYELVQTQRSLGRGVVEHQQSASRL
jgi:hypothetical protein